jgi:thiol-disulfide isomerase/thioredoxin
MKKFLLVLAAFAALVSCKNAVKDADSEYAVDMIKKGEVLPAFSLKDRADVLHSPDEFAGKYVVYDFWATWCPDCRADVPAMKELYAKYGDKVAFVGVSFDTDPEKLDAYVAENGIEWLQLSDFVAKKESKVADAFHVKWIPSMYLVGPDGKVLLGTVMVDKLAAALEAL